ncbi:HsdS specificity protein of type I restriction-modification system [Leuconostoc lactis]|uniref:restriction endonuclease subunit S n=1 Tax=Leuconostoc lactis TaxID=1246 RepID=UPI0024A19FA5|nr:restriction endonuclease subunit S [Leuconostoc lactis]GLY46132.1 HsdS specificity protein of type I restriction-modification system [Leuconostoc lactis]
MSKKTPQIRFKGFTDDWEERKLGEFTTSFSGGTPSAGISSYYQGDIPFIRSGEINSDKTELFLTESGLKNSSAKMVSVGDILYALYGATSGEVGISQINGAINQAILAIKPSNGYSSEFIMQWLKLQKQKIIDKYLQGGQGNLSGSIVKDLVLNVPDFEEQQKIGSFFKQLDDTITLHQRKLDLLKEQKKGFLQKMFPKNGAKIPELRFAGFADTWEQRKFENVVDVKSGKDYKHLKEGTVPVYGTGGYMLSVDKSLSAVDAIGIGRKGTIDKPYLLKAPFWTVDTLFYAIPKQNVDLQFSLAIFKKINWKKFDESTGVPSLSKSAINSVKVVVPVYEEQQNIGSFFKQLDDLITLHQRKLDILKKQKKGFLQKMFVS